ncbi:DUF2505 domain-containing protein [Mycolicibacterium holsaticum]|jgi:hypothetical protein|uniref:DUF2505 domain-containing protein n=1 Tax=Mycolicibacterium holsaticum TaxID=152142 RepID=UPI001C7CDBC0|nr:DUF2505 domain-containing protein [Mycolicibacterium holsaticum]MDA4110883.1 hypothetical protein [Mycolicibacterium holsaticum DSM 44478 = JCM 12374]QZA12171.1 DUF2505 domain-containing protein [Mycolicibacterium holsaticum DSM 44478 = JCM 12374]UNC10343.1 DUF2505 domain-containing protein [Mycolicibacterium holsaticum DSM 44478 = JCM 12374]
MPRSFEGQTESSASVEQIHAAFGSADYWRARLATSDATAELDSLAVDPDGTVEVHLTQYLGRQLLPASVTKFLPGDVKLLHGETWRPAGDGEVRGQISVAISGGLGSCHAKTCLVPAAEGSQLSFTGRVEVKIPLVGGNFEKSLGANLAASIPEVVRFTTTWITDHA